MAQLLRYHPMNKSLWLLGGLLACTVALATPRPDRVALEAAIHRWMVAVNAQDAETLGKTMTGDVELLDSTTTVTGRDAAIQRLREIVTRGQLAAADREISISGDIAWRVAALTQTRKSGDVHARGQVLEIWKRVKGQWQLHRQMTTGLPIPDSLTRPSTDEPVLDRPGK